MNAWTDCSVVSTMAEGKWRYCLQLLQYCYITLLWQYGLTEVLLVESKCRFCLQLLQYCHIP